MSRRALVPTATLVTLLASALLAHLDSASAKPTSTPSPAASPLNVVAPDGLTTLTVYPALDPATGAPYLAGAERPAVLVLPGWNCTASLYTKLAAFLAGRGYVVAVFQHEDNLDELAEDWEPWAEGALDLLIAHTTSPLSPLFHEIDPTKIGVVGHSLGGAAATLLAAQDPRVHALVLCAPQSPDNLFTSAAYAIQAPLLTVDASLDRLAPWAQCSGAVIANAASAAKGSVVIANGNHTNCPADFDLDYIRDTGRWVMKPLGYWPFFEWVWDWPIVPGVKPIPGDRQRAIGFPYVGGWFDRYLDGQKDPQGWTTGKEADAQVKQGVLTQDSWSAATRKSP